jgi:two-component system CheB/CheR fusion protein
MEAIGQLTGGVAHDFNNLLAVMMGNLALLEDELGADNDLTELTTPMMRAVDRASELTKRMLAFARLQPLAVGNVNVNALLNQMQPLLLRSLAEEIDVELIMASDLKTCIADPGQLEQAILNMAINARDAMPKGGRLEIRTRNVTIADDASDIQVEAEPGDYVVITVADHGHGIPAVDQLRIFEPFFTTKEVGRGTGLGLSMVYGFIKQSNGHIMVQSEEGIGTTFQLYLPVA